MDKFLQNSQISDFITIRSAVLDLFYAYRRTDAWSEWTGQVLNRFANAAGTVLYERYSAEKSFTTLKRVFILQMCIYGTELKRTRVSSLLASAIRVDQYICTRHELYLAPRPLRFTSHWTHIHALPGGNWRYIHFIAARFVSIFFLLCIDCVSCYCLICLKYTR
jgi:hypothetical protein